MEFLASEVVDRAVKTLKDFSTSWKNDQGFEIEITEISSAVADGNYESEARMISDQN